MLFQLSFQEPKVEPWQSGISNKRCADPANTGDVVGFGIKDANPSTTDNVGKYS